MKKLFFLTLAAIALCVFLEKPKSESAIRASALKLTSDRGSCSGEQVEAPSGKTYVLTAAHCGILAKAGYITVTDESGKVYEQKVLEEDPISDLLLLEGIPELPGLKIADDSRVFEPVRTFTHGGGMPLYKTEGALMGDKRLSFAISEIHNEQESQDCLSMAKNIIVDSEDFIGEPVKICVLSVEETITTASVIPGSSGGMVVDDAGALVGVVSGGNGYFGMIVRLQDIHHFLSKR